jgi:tetratricopeptide (TPR) repeat protein
MVMHISLKNKIGILPAVILTVLIAAAYIPTFSGEFILDDRPLVKDNLFIREFNGAASYLTQEDGVGDGGLTGYHTGYYRPLINLFYWIDYKVWGMKASGFRITNLVFHVFTCIILYQFLFSLFKRRLISFAATLVFGLHPVNTEAVAWISSRNNILVTLFSMLSFFIYTKNMKAGNIWAGLLSYLFFLAALFSKEFAVMLLFIFFLYNRFVAESGRISREEILGYLPFVLILAFYFVLRANVIGSLLTPISVPNGWKHLYFSPFLIAYDLRLILLPYGLHSFIVHYPDDYLSWQAFAGFIFLCLLAFFLWKARNLKIVKFSLFSFLVALFPVLNIIHTSAVTAVSMRWLYFPMIFLSFSLAWVLQELLNRNRSFVWVILTSVAVYLGTYSYTLNRNLWHDEDTFFEQEVLNFGNTYYAGGLAERLFENENLEEAERYFQVAINQYPQEARNYINYSALLIDTGRPDEALGYLNKVKSWVTTPKEHGQLFNNLGMAYYRLGRRDDALNHLIKAVKFFPDESQFWSNIGSVYGSMGDYANSVSALRKGLKISPDSIPLKLNLALTYIRTQDYKGAISILETVPVHERQENQQVEGLLKQARREFKEKN